MTRTRQFCTFHVQDLIFGIDVKEVQEVIRYQEMTGVPLAPPVIRGLINLRGQIVSAIDMRKQLQLPNDGPEYPMNVVIRTKDGAVSLLVDEIGDVLEVEMDRRESLPETLSDRLKQLVDNVYKLDGALLLELNTDATLGAAAAQGGAAA